MEVTNVSPSPTSPPEGDDLCEIDFTDVAIHSVTLFIGLSGLAGNGAVLCLLSQENGTYGIFSLAVTDFLFLLFTVPAALLLLVEDVSCSPIMPPLFLSFLFQLSQVSYYWALYRLLPRNRVFYMYKLLKLCFPCKLTLRLQWFVRSVQYWAFFALFTVIPMVTSMCPPHHQEQCRAALFSVFTIILLLYAAPLLISSTIYFIKAKRGSQLQQPSRRDFIIFLFPLFTLLLSLCNFMQQLGYIPAPTQVFFLLTCIHSSIKPYIYFLAGRCWRSCSIESLRLSLQRVFGNQNEETDLINDTNTDTVI